MAVLKITRKDEIFNRGRAIGVYIDGRKIGTIDNNETKEFELVAGQHKLKCKIDWCGSPELSFIVENNETKAIEVLAYRYSGALALVIIAALASYFLLRHTSMGAYAYWVLLPAFLAFIPQFYYFTFGRNAYLVVKEL